MKSRILAAVTVISVLALSACAHGPSKDEVQAAVQASRTPDCIHTVMSLPPPPPINIFEGMMSNYAQREYDRAHGWTPQQMRQKAQVDALVNAGILERVPLSTMEQMAAFFSGPPASKFRFTDSGHKFAHGANTLCYGHDAVNVTTFASSTRDSASAKFTYHVADIPAWAQRSAVRSAYPAIAQHIAGAGHACTATLHNAKGVWRVTHTVCGAKRVAKAAR